jgi:CrcB protein
MVEQGPDVGAGRAVNSDPAVEGVIGGLPVVSKGGGRVVTSDRGAGRWPPWRACVILAPMSRFLWICLGGAGGTGVRYLVGLWAGQRLGTAFPYGTLFVNLGGCFLISFMMHVALNVAAFPANLRLALTTGFLGGLTTYSSFNFETTRLLEDGAPRSALLNLGLTVIGCFVAGLLGLALARKLVG